MDNKQPRKLTKKETIQLLMNPFETPKKENVSCLRCNDNGCPACDGTKGDEHNPEPY